LRWQHAIDNSGTLARYQLSVNGRRAARYPPAAHTATLRTFRPVRRTALVLRALDPTGNLGDASRTIFVSPVRRPRSVPARVPVWASRLLRWQAAPAARRGPRPETPKPLPAWYAAWGARRLRPYRSTHHYAVVAP